jgi:hypothetical protein
MIKATSRLAKDLHRRMGYPLGKVHYKVQTLVQNCKGYGSPMRHVRRVSYKARNLKDVMTRKAAARDLTRGLNPAIAGRVKEFRENGFTYITDLVDPKLTAELLQFHGEVLEKRSETAKSLSSHPFFFPLSQPEDFTTDNILVRFAMQDSILQAISAYFGSLPFLDVINVLESRSAKITKKSQLASQQWHLDYSCVGDDVVSLWVYLTDVNTTAQGPLTYIPIPGSRKVKNDLFPRRIEDEEIEGAGLTPEVKQVFGPRATVFLINTHKCYHMGSRLQEGERRVACIFAFAKSREEENFIKLTSPVEKEKELVICR